MNELLGKRAVKVFCIYINPLIIGCFIPYIIEHWGDKSIVFYIGLILGVVLSILYCYTSYMYEKDNKNSNDEKKKLRNEIENCKNKNSTLEKESRSFDKGMRELSTLFCDSSKCLNDISKNILKGDRTLELWNFKKSATGVCNSIYNLLCNLCTPYDDFTVNIMLVDPMEKGRKKNITMIAHKGKYEKYPDKFGEKLYFEKNKTFYAVKLCKSEKNDIRILTTKAEVDEKFVYVDEEHPQYNQYVGIPIVCNKNQILCLLQICALGDNKIADSKAVILEIVKKYILPFTYYSLLTYKMEKCMVSSFATMDKEEEKIYGEN